MQAQLSRHPRTTISGACDSAKNASVPGPFQFAFLWVVCVCWSLRSSRQRAYCSAFVGSGSSWPLSQKQNQSTLPCCEIMRSQGFSRVCVPSGIYIISTGLPSWTSPVYECQSDNSEIGYKV